MRRAVSRKTSDRRSVRLRWLASWNSREFWPTKNTGTTVALEERSSFAVKGAQGRSTAGPFSGFSEVETPPPGKMPMAWPCFSQACACDAAS